MIGRRGKKKIAVIDSDESDEELEIERRALSPSTRRSMGVFVASESEEDEIEEEEEEEQDSKKDEEAEEESSNDEETPENESKTQKSRRETLHKPRLSEFESSIQQKISSTLFPKTSDDTITAEINSPDSSLQLIESEPETFNISSSIEEAQSPKHAEIQPKITNLLTKVTFFVHIQQFFTNFFHF